MLYCLDPTQREYHGGGYPEYYRRPPSYGNPPPPYYGPPHYGGGYYNPGFDGHYHTGPYPDDYSGPREYFGPGYNPGYGYDGPGYGYEYDGPGYGNYGPPPNYYGGHDGECNDQVVVLCIWLCSILITLCEITEPGWQFAPSLLCYACFSACGANSLSL